MGTLGIAQVLKHTERADRHALIARAYRKRISEISQENEASSIEEVHQAAATKHKNAAGLAYSMRARWFWLCMHVAIIAIGISILLLHHIGALKS
jgi:hypothetical protein